ncbi:MAG: MurR/RpiR family transcriptional regulator [Clostridia bacterium]|nr:MurR/RpiR family transcriptional regulator [Clostridia bacterium]
MTGDLLLRIREEMPGFSKSQKRIAEYISDNLVRASYLTANGLSKQIGVSESTIVRFAMELGFEGFPEMQQELRNLVLHQLTSAQRLERTSNYVKDKDLPSLIFRSDAERIRQTEKDFDSESFRAAVEALSEAQTVYVIGSRAMGMLAQVLGYALNYLFENVRVITSASAVELSEQLYHVKKGDVAIGLSFPRYSSTTTQALRQCRAARAKVILLTDRKQSVVAEQADHVLVAKTGMISFFDSLTAPMSVINVLVAATAIKREDVLMQKLTHLETIWDENDVYESSVN